MEKPICKNVTCLCCMTTNTESLKCILVSTKELLKKFEKEIIC